MNENSATTAEVEKQLKNTKRGQVWVVDLGENLGSEQNGIRPCLVLNQQKYWEKTSIIIIGSNTKRYSTIEKNGFRFLLHQIKTIDNSRLVRHLYHFPKKDTDEVLEKLMQFLQ